MHSISQMVDGYALHARIITFMEELNVIGVKKLNQRVILMENLSIYLDINRSR